MSEALYLFCLCKPAAEEAGGPGTGKVFLHRFGKLAAAVEEISQEEFAGAEAEERMKQLEWLAPRVERHEAVIERLLRVSPVLPARFATLFSNQAALDRFLTVNHVTVERFLEDMEGKDEWGVKVVLDRARAGERLLAKLTGQPPDSPASRGADYLRERQLRAQIAKHVSSWLAQTMCELQDRLRGYAVALKERPIGIQAPAGEPQTVGNFALLARREVLPYLRKALEAASHEYEAYGVSFDLSGPWPPYSFCPALEDAA